MGTDLTARAGEPKTRARRSGEAAPILHVWNAWPAPRRKGARRTGPAGEEQP